MPLFPDIATLNFVDIQFYSHVSGGFKRIKEYWLKCGKCTHEQRLWFYAPYICKKRAHTIVLNVQEVHKGCADMEFHIFSKSTKDIHVSASPDHKITEKEFLGLFKLLAGKGSRIKIGGIGFRFKRYVNMEFPLFPIKKQPVDVVGIKFKLSKRSPISSLYIENVGKDKIILDVLSKPTFGIDKKLLNDRFFERPIQVMNDLTNAMVNLPIIKEKIYGR